jgi:sodium/potassium/calcium exchanger 6
MECSYEYIQNHFDMACKIASEACETSYVNFYAMHYCSFNGHIWLTIPLTCLFIFICFYILSDTSNIYLSTSLTILAEKLRISQNLAGVTFLALGNGAPDVISSFVASEGGDGGIEMAIGALAGAGIFVSAVVLSSVVLLSGQVKVNKVLFIRDIILFIASLVILLVFSYYGKVVLWQSICFLSIYIVYVIVAILLDIYMVKEKTGHVEEGAEEADVKSERGTSISDNVDCTANQEKNMANDVCDILMRKSSANLDQNSHLMMHTLHHEYFYESLEEEEKCNQSA